MTFRLDTCILWTESSLDIGGHVRQVVRNRVRDLRNERGWTQQELGRLVGVSRQSINSIERGRYVPSLPLALRFARVFKCFADEIFELESAE